ncbi:hypothetical protein [Emticicia fontis]
MARYNFEIEKQKYFEQYEDLSDFYKKNEGIFEIIGYHDVFGDYTHLSYSFLAFLELKEKLCLINPSARILLIDSY